MKGSAALVGVVGLFSMALAACGGGTWQPPPVATIPVPPPMAVDRLDDTAAVDPVGAPKASASEKGAADALDAMGGD